MGKVNSVAIGSLNAEIVFVLLAFVGDRLNNSSLPTQPRLGL